MLKILTVSPAASQQIGLGSESIVRVIQRVSSAGDQAESAENYSELVGSTVPQSAKLADFLCPLPIGAVKEALATQPPAVRRELARLVPWLCLTDRDPTVRRHALESMISVPTLITAYASQILIASLPQAHDTSEVQEGRGLISMSELELAIAAAPTLAKLAILHPTSLREVVLRLVRAAKVSASNEAIGNTDSTVVDALDQVALRVDMRAIRDFVSTDDGKKRSKRLQEISTEWRKLFNSWAQSGWCLDAAEGGPQKEGAHHNYSELPTTGDNRALLSEVQNVAMQEKYNLILKHEQSQEWMQAIRLSSELRTQSPEAFERHNIRARLEDRLLPAIVRQLPEPKSFNTLTGSPEFSPEDLQPATVDAALALLGKLMELCPEEAAKSIHAQTRRLDIAIAKVDSILHDANGAPSKAAGKARQWLKMHKINSPAVLSRIDAFEVSGKLETLPVAVVLGEVAVPNPLSRQQTAFAEPLYVERAGEASQPAYEHQLGQRDIAKQQNWRARGEYFQRQQNVWARIAKFRKNPTQTYEIALEPLMPGTPELEAAHTHSSRAEQNNRGRSKSRQKSCNVQ